MPQRRSALRTVRGQVSWPWIIVILLVLAAAAFFEVGQGEGSPQPTAPAATSLPGAFPTLTLDLPVIQPSSPTDQAAGTQPAETEPAAPAGAPEGGITVWFSDPLAKQTTGGPEEQLIAGIDQAKKTVDMAIYNLSLPNVRDALLRAKKRGVKVRLVMESESMDKTVPQSLKKAGIPIVGDQKEGLMHNKFTLIDGQVVFMGSMNYTATSAYQDFNNLVRFTSDQLVLDYQANFDEMFSGHKFGTDKQPNTPYPQVTVGSTPVEVYFSPDDGVAKAVMAELRKATKSIDILAYSFTSNDLAGVIRARAKAGVKVRGVFDESQYKSNSGGEFDVFKKAGYDVRIDGIPGLLHDKVFIIDGQVVITGSYNFSSNAENTNDENLVIIRDRGIAAAYLKHFKQVYGSSQ